MSPKREKERERERQTERQTYIKVSCTFKISIDSFYYVNPIIKTSNKVWISQHTRSPLVENVVETISMHNLYVMLLDCK